MLRCWPGWGCVVVSPAQGYGGLAHHHGLVVVLNSRGGLTALSSRGAHVWQVRGPTLPARRLPLATPRRAPRVNGSVGRPALNGVDDDVS